MAKKRKRSKSVQLIKKSNDLIEAHYRFDIWETRVFLSVLANIHKDDEDFKPYRIRYGDMIKSFGLKSHQSYDLLRAGARSLMSKTFMVNSRIDGFERVKEYHIIRTVDYLKGGQEGEGIENQEYIDITVEPEMKPLLLQLQRNFTAYNLSYIAKLGAQPIRIYELLKQYQSFGSRTLVIEELRKMLEYEDEYQRFADFYRYVITPAVKSINKHTDIEIYKQEKIRKGRKIHAVKLYFKEKQKSKDTADIPQNIEVPFLLEQTNKDQLFEKYQEVVKSKFGVTPSVFMKLLDQYSAEQIEQAIRVTQRAKYKQQIKSNVAGFFVKALRNGYTDEKEEAKKTEQRQTKQQQAKRQAALLELKETYAQALNDIIRTVIQAHKNITEEAIDSLSQNAITKSILAQKEVDLGRVLDIEDFRQDKILREMMKAKIIELQPTYFADCKQQFELKIQRLEREKK